MRLPSSFLDFLEHLYYTPLMSETLTRTICIKLDVGGNEAALAETQQQFNAAATWIATVCWEERITSTHTAHHRVYGETRARFGLGAQLSVCARAKAMEAIKATKTQESERKARWRKEHARRRDKGKKALPPPEPATCPQFGPRSSIRYDARTYRLLALDRVSLNTLRGRIACRLLPGKWQHDMLVDPTWEIGGAELVWRRGVYSLHVAQTRSAPAHAFPGRWRGYRHRPGSGPYRNRQFRGALYGRARAEGPQSLRRPPSRLATGRHQSGQTSPQTDEWTGAPLHERHQSPHCQVPGTQSRRIAQGTGPGRPHRHPGSDNGSPRTPLRTARLGFLPIADVPYLQSSLGGRSVAPGGPGLYLADVFSLRAW